MSTENKHLRTSQQTIDHLLDILEPRAEVRARKMFGEYALYCDEKVVALVCRDELVVKDTPKGNEFAKELEHKPAYPGAKPGLHVPRDRWEDREWLAKLIQITADSLPTKKKQ